jgi:predicted secreted protein
MAFRHGRLAEITVNTKALSTFCESADLSIDVDTADTSTFTSTWKTALAGLAGGKVDLKGFYDPTATTGPAAVLTALIGTAPFAVLVYPGGNTSGQVSRGFNAILTSYSEGSPVGDKVTFSASLLVTGAITFAAI